MLTLAVLRVCRMQQDEDLTLDAIDGFIQSVCPNLDIAMRKLANWVNASDTLLVPALLAPQVDSF